MSCLRGCKLKNTHLSECSDNDCYGCIPKPAANGRKVCDNCAERFLQSILKLIAVMPDLDNSMVNGFDFSKHDRVSGTKDVGIVLNEQVFATKTRIKEWAGWVEGIIISEGGATGYPSGQDTITVLKFLARHHEWLLNHEIAGNFVEDAAGLLKGVVVTANPIRKARMTVPGEKCLNEVEDGLCNGELIATMRDDNGKTALFFYCAKDPSHLLKPEQFVPVSRKLHNFHVSTNDAAALLETSGVHIHMLARRKGWRSFKANRKRFYAWMDVEKYLLERKS